MELAVQVMYGRDAGPRNVCASVTARSRPCAELLESLAQRHPGGLLARAGAPAGRLLKRGRRRTWSRYSAPLTRARARRPFARHRSGCGALPAVGRARTGTGLDAALCASTATPPAMASSCGAMLTPKRAVMPTTARRRTPSGLFCSGADSSMSYPALSWTYTTEGGGGRWRARSADEVLNGDGVPRRARGAREIE